MPRNHYNAAQEIETEIADGRRMMIAELDERATKRMIIAMTESSGENWRLYREALGAYYSAQLNRVDDVVWERLHTSQSCRSMRKKKCSSNSV